MADIVGFGDAGVWTALATGDGRFTPAKLVLPGFGANQGWTSSKHVRLLADINKDSIADIVGFGDDGVWTALATGDGGFSAAKFVLAGFGANQAWTPSKHALLLADINKDSMADIVGFGDDGVWTALALGDGGFAAAKFVLAGFGANQAWTPSKHVRLLADINKDGMVDIVGFGDDGVWTALATGDGGFAAAKFVLAGFGANQAWTPSKHVLLLADINKDSMADIVGFGDDGVWTALALGDGGFAAAKFVLAGFGANQAWTPSKHVRLLADINKDGMVDIVGFGDDGVWTALATGDGGFAAAKFVLAGFGANQAWTPSKHVLLLADINKDGIADIIGFGQAGVLTALATGDGVFGSAHLVLGEMFSCAGRLDFNLEGGAFDPNGFPLNPRWRWQRDNPGVPSAGLCHYFTKTVRIDDGWGNYHLAKVADCADCTDQTDPSNVDTAKGFPNVDVCNFGSEKGFHGHLNWFATTFIGQVWFGDCCDADGEYYLALVTPGNPAVISGDEDPPRGSLHTEFDTDETINYFQTPWWKSFRDTDNRTRKEMMGENKGGKYAIMTGLFGVDLEHEGGRSELHPVYAMAVNVSDDPADNVWAIFVRNWGNEGYCSHRDWPAEFTTYTFRLPWREGMREVEVLGGANQSQFGGTAGTSGPAIVWAVDQGVNVTFTLPSPSQRPLIEGELHLRWLDQPPIGRSSATFAGPRLAFGPDRVEKHVGPRPLGEAMDRLSPAKRRLVENARQLGQVKTLKMDRLPPVAAGREVKELPTPPSVAVRLGTKGDVATRRISQDAAQLRALCEAWNGSPPGLPPDFCKKIAR